MRKPTPEERIATLEKTVAKLKFDADRAMTPQQVGEHIEYLREMRIARERQQAEYEDKIRNHGW